MNLDGCQRMSTRLNEKLSLFKAPAAEKETMSAKSDPPRGPKSALPKSRATVLLSPTVSCSALSALEGGGEAED